MVSAMVGTAAWSIPAQHAHAFPAEGSHLERYSRRFPAVVFIANLPAAARKRSSGPSTSANRRRCVISLGTLTANRKCAGTVAAQRWYVLGRCGR